MDIVILNKYFNDNPPILKLENWELNILNIMQCNPYLYLLQSSSYIPNRIFTVSAFTDYTANPTGTIFLV